MAKQSLLTGAAALVMAQAVVLALGFITHPLVGRFLGPEAYGIYGVVLSIQTIVSLILTLGVPVAISRFVAQDELHARSILQQALRIQLILALGISVGTALLSPAIAWLLGDSSLQPYILFIALVIFVQAGYPVFTQYLSGMHRFNKQAALTALYAISKLVGAVGLLFVFHIYGAFSGFAIGGIIAAFVGWQWTQQMGGTAIKRLPLRSFLEFAGMYAFILIGLQLLMSLDLFMVKALLRNGSLTGFYTAAGTLSRIPYLLLQGLSFVLLPSVAALTKPGASQAKARLFIRDTVRYLIALIVPSVALGATTSKQLILLFFESKQYVPAAPALTILIVGLGSLAFYLLLANIAAGAGKARFPLIVTTGLLVVSVTLGFVLIPRFGLLGAAWQTTVTSLAGLAILTIYIVSVFQIPVPVRSTINIIIASAIAILPTYVWRPTPLGLLGEYAGLVALYVGVLWLLGEITEHDRRRLASLHPKLSWVAPPIDIAL